MPTPNRINPLDCRRAGVLLHPTSLPGAPDNGDLGANAYWFVDFLAKAGCSIWQTLPLGPTHEDLSPYQAKSIHAGNPRLISLDLLRQDGWLVDATPYPEDETEIPVYRERQLHNARKGFLHHASATDQSAYQAFLTQRQWWVDDYALFQTCKERFHHVAWWEWDATYRDREPEALAELRQSHADIIEYFRFEQFVFFRQWLALKKYANTRGIYLFGDLPIFVAADSVDVWAKRQNFQLDENGHPTVVAGVPPDYFSATGQRWGNPHYDWNYMQEQGFSWWLERLNAQDELFDVVRIDHFRGFEAYWEIDASAPTAVHGRWVKAPGDELFTRIQTVGTVPLVAEDLGVITEEVNALRVKFHIPGMRILQFAFDGGPANPYLPHNYEPNTVVYTGTHDNDTTVGWFTSLSPQQQQDVYDYLACEPDTMPWPLIRSALASVAKLAVIPMQDLMALDGAHRMNKPGVPEGNWRWRFTWEEVPKDLDTRVRALIDLYGRL